MLTLEEEIVWLACLRTGDRVAIGDYVTSVTRVTPSMLVCGPYRFNRMTGKMLGASGFSIRYLRPVTPELLDKALRSRLVTKLRNDSMNDVPTTTLVAVVALLDRARSGHE
jgi:hypothetical protein